MRLTNMQEGARKLTPRDEKTGRKSELLEISNLNRSIRYLMTTVAIGMSGGRTTTCKRVLHHNKAVIICKDKIIKGEIIH